MKKKSAWKRFKILAILFLVLFNMMVSEKKVAKAETNKFVIDTENVYPDMEEAYKDGYIPSVSDGKAKIVLPLILDDNMDTIPSAITAAVDYGNTVGSPFVIKQYKKQVSPETYELPNGRNNKAFLIQFNLDLKSNRVNGTYLINIKVEYKVLTLSDNSVYYTSKEQVFPIYVTISDGINSEDKVDTPKANAKLKLVNCNISPREIHPGDTFTVTAKLENISQTSKIEKMKINYENVEGILTPVEPSGNIYIDEIAAGQTKSISFQLNSATTITNYNQKIILQIQYEDMEGNPYSDTENIYITIQPTPEDVSGTTSNLFEVETNHTFTRMDSSYKNGYVPAIHKGNVSVVMPLNFKGNGKVYGDEITASIEFANTDKQPFEIKSYIKKVKLKNCKSKEGEKMPLYLIDLSMDLDTERINGVYPVNIKIQYELDSVVKEQIFTVYIVIKDGIDPNEVEDPEVKTPTPKIIVTSSTQLPSSCHTGDLVTFQVTLKNTNKDMDVQNIKLTYSSDTGDLTPSTSSNSIYIDLIKAGKTKNITFEMKIAGEVSTPNQSISLKIDGEDKDASSITSVESIYLTVELPFGLKVESPVLANEMKSGSKKTITFPIMNTGKTKIRNIICELSMDGVISTSTFFLGELDPAASKKVSLKAIIANKMITDESVPESEKYGYVSGTITVSYEDMEGKTYHEVIDVNTKITPKKEITEKGEISAQWWISIMIGLIIIQIIVFLAMFYRKKRSI